MVVPDFFSLFISVEVESIVDIIFVVRVDVGILNPYSLVNIGQRVWRCVDNDLIEVRLPQNLLIRFVCADILFHVIVVDCLDGFDEHLLSTAFAVARVDVMVPEIKMIFQYGVFFATLLELA